jgi:nicotinate-nucleotide pyrophosphorylase (carboxylating)
LDVREFLFRGIREKIFFFEVAAAEEGIFAGSERLSQAAGNLGIQILWVMEDGGYLDQGTVVFKGIGSPAQVAASEDMLLGLIGKPSGVATAARRFALKAGNQIRIVCGAWKKVASENKKYLRRAIAVGRIGLRVVEEPFVYLDKNYVRMFDGISSAVKRAGELRERVVVVQLRGEYGTLPDEAREAVTAGAGILMIDTGRIEDLRAVVSAIEAGGWRSKIKIAFGGGVTVDKLPDLIDAGADIVDVGRSIIDAPLLDFRLNVKSSQVRTDGMGSVRKDDFLG